MNNDKTILKYWIIWSVGIISSMLLFVVYKNHLKDFFNTNISTSNLLPYTIMIAIGISASLIGAKINLKYCPIYFSKKKSLLVEWLVMICILLLCVFCYRNELNLFATYPAQFYSYHLFNREVTAFSISVFCLVYTYIENLNVKIEKKLSKNIFVITFLFIGFIFVYSTFSPNTLSNFFNRVHNDVYYNSIFNAMNEIPRSSQNISVYGFYAFLVAPVIKALGGRYIDFQIVFSFISLLSFFCLVYIIIKLVKHKFIAYLGCIAMIVPVTSTSFEIYRQGIPHRLIFPSLVMALLAINDGTRKHNMLCYIVSMFAVIWNIETGIVCIAACIGFNMLKILQKYKSFDKEVFKGTISHIFYGFLTLMLSWASVNLFNTIMYNGKVLNLYDFFYPLGNAQFLNGQLKTEYQNGIVIWELFFALALTLIVYSICQTTLNNGEKVELDGNAPLLFSLSIVILGMMAYYINRQAPINIKMTWMFAMIALCALIDLQLSNISKDNQLIRSISMGVSKSLITILILIVLGGIFNYSTAANFRNQGQFNKIGKVYEIEKIIKENCLPNTRAIGTSIPVLYSDLGWDNYYHNFDTVFTTVGQIKVQKEYYEYFERELNENLNEPILIDSDAKAYFDKSIKLEAFNKKFKLEKEFTLYDLKLFYYVPVTKK